MDLDLSTIPLGSGVYLFKDAQDRILYVGKARRLRRRLASYFRSNNFLLTPKAQAMLRLARRVDILCTATEKEALLLEASLIKKHRPRYNIVLRDDKQYILFRLDKTAVWPRLTLTRRVVRDGSIYYGPFTSAGAARDTWKAIHHVFSLRRCSDRIFVNRVRPCLYHGLSLCPAPCVLPVDPQDYGRLVRRVELLLSGRSGELVRAITVDMEAAAEALEFERAARLRDQIRAIQCTVEQQAVILPGSGDLDVAAVAEADGGLGLGLLFVRQGRLLDKRTFFWPGFTLEAGPEALFGFLAQFYGSGRFIPPRILVPWDFRRLAAAAERAEKLFGVALSDPTLGGLPSTDRDLPVRVFQAEGTFSSGEFVSDHMFEISDLVLAELDPSVLAEALVDRAGHDVHIAMPVSGAEKRLIALARANAREAAKAYRQPCILTILADRLGLSVLPSRIEAVDVAHHRGQATRAAMVVFENGRPARDQYRQYVFLETRGGIPDKDGEIVGEVVQNIRDISVMSQVVANDSASITLDGIDVGLARGDDCAVLAAWTRRRLAAGPPWPDLLLIDGGKGQLMAVKRVLLAATGRLGTGREDVGRVGGGIESVTAIPLAAIAKDPRSSHGHSRHDRIFLPGSKNPLNLAPGSPELLFLQQIRDTAHAFVVGGHRQSRRKALITGELQGVPGVGPKIALRLWGHFSSLEAMAMATAEELAAIPGIGLARSRILAVALRLLTGSADYKRRDATAGKV
ncbi:UvrABC system protein C [Desulfovibrionales bacterium]